MSDTNVQECDCCQIETDCINGLCGCCSDYDQKQRQYTRNLQIALEVLETKNKNLKKTIAEILCIVEKWKKALKGIK